MMKDFKPAKRHVEVSIAESVRILRELQEMSQTSWLSRAVSLSQQSRQLRTVVSVWVWKGRRPLPVRCGVIQQFYCFLGGMSR